MKANLKDENSSVSSFHYFWQRVFISGKRLETFHSCTFCDFAFFSSWQVLKKISAQSEQLFVLTRLDRSKALLICQLGLPSPLRYSGPPQASKVQVSEESSPQAPRKPPSPPFWFWLKPQETSSDAFWHISSPPQWSPSSLLPCRICSPRAS